MWGSWLAIDSIHLYTTIPPSGISDFVVTSSNGIPDITKAAVFSASFVGSTENTTGNPSPIFTTDSEYFSISNSYGLGHLQVNNSFNYFYDLGTTSEQIFVTCSTAETTMENGLASTTPITINILVNPGPSISVSNVTSTVPPLYLLISKVVTLRRSFSVAIVGPF